MQYERIKKAKFLARPNRFIAHVELDGRTEICHVKNTGRCRELLMPGADIFIQESDNPNRKTKYDLISVYKGDTLINMDSQIPNKVVEEWLRNGRGRDVFPQLTVCRPEQKYRNSRFDFYLEVGEAECDRRKIYMEVKGVTLEENHVAMFPDAPTERGVKHISELIEARKEGFDAYLFFVIQLKGIQSFTPNRRTHEAFAQKLVEAQEAGVKILAYDCSVKENGIEIDQPIPVVL